MTQHNKVLRSGHTFIEKN